MAGPDPLPDPPHASDSAHAELARVQEALRVSEAGRRESRTFFEKSFEANPAFMTIARIADGCLLEVNPAFVRGSGYSREEALGRSTLELKLWERRDERDEFLRRMQAQGVVRDFEANFRAKSGEVRTLLLNADVIEIDGPPCMLTVGIDITERRRRERVQEATYRISQVVLAGGDLGTLFKEIHAIIGRLMSARNFYIALLSADGTQVSFPFFLDEFVPPPPPRPRGNGFSEYILETAAPLLATAEEIPVLLARRGYYQKLPRPAAQRLGAPLCIDGRAIGVIALQDYRNPRAYTEEDKRLLMFVADQAAAAVRRRNAEEALRRAELQYRGIFENALEGLYQSTPDGRFLRVNPALARMFGYASPTELIQSVNDIEHQLYVKRGRRAEFMRMVEQRDEVTDFKSEINRRDGSRIWIAESVRVIRDSQGGVSHFEGVAVEITQQREAALALQAAKDAADAASRAKSYFLASVSHELRTPLNGILGYTQILRRDPELGEKQRKGVRVIHESAEHLLVLINDMLDLSKIEAGRIELQPVDFDVVDFMAGVERVFVPRAREKGLMLETQVDAGEAHWVRGDEARLRQIVYNLVANAVKFTERGGVVLSLQREPTGGWRFSVSDSGPGIAPEDLGRLFEPFTQVGSHCAGGTGLGLAISRSLVERMGGKLQVESQPGWGSRFWFVVDLPTVAPASAPGVSSGMRRVTGYDGPRRRVLIVDDNLTNRSLLLELLAPLGFDLAEAADGLAAVQEAERFSPDLVLMDLRLPGGMDGLEATRRLRAREQATGAPRRAIVAVSASAYDLDRAECLAAGCDAFLAKPFDEEALWAVMGRVLGLSWRTTEAEDTRTPFPFAVEPPPVEEAQAIYDLAAKGDVVGIRARAQALVERDASYQLFAQGVLELAGRFKMKAIRQFVERYLDRKPSTSKERA